MDTSNQVVRLCIQVTQAEYAGRLDDARSLARRAWELAADDYEACMAAHYVARFEPLPLDRLHWDRVALERADRVGDERVRDFYPSLYASLGHACELAGDLAQAQKYFAMSGIQRE